MKKIKIVLLSAVLALTLCACGPIHEPSPSEQARKDQAIQIATTKVIDALNDFAHTDAGETAYTELTFNELSVDVATKYGVDADGYVLATAISSFERGIEEAGEIVYVDYSTATATIDGNEIIVDVVAVCEKRYADIQIIITNDSYDHTVVGGAFNTRYTMPEKMEKAGLNTVIGMITVFAMLLIIRYIISFLKPFTDIVDKVSSAIKEAFGKIKASFKKKDKAEEGIDKAVEQIVKNETVESTDAELVAVIAAAVAAYEGTTDTSGFVVRSIRKIKRQ